MVTISNWVDNTKVGGNFVLYCQAKVTRSGIGNRLIPWARCLLYGHLHNLPVLQPIWPLVPKGFFIRGRQWRYYFATFYHRELTLRAEAIHLPFWKRLMLHCFAERISEPTLISDKQSYQNKNVVLVFSRPKPPKWPTLCFSEFEGYHKLLLKKIRNITHPIVLARIDSLKNIPIGIHVRTEMNIGGDVSWFVDTLKRIRQEVGYDVPAVVGADTKGKEISSLLEMNNITLLRGPAIADLLILSKAKLFLASGHSSFSAWISFLGQMPSFCNPSKLEDGKYPWERLGIKSSEGQYQGPFDPLCPNPEALKEIQKTVSVS